MGLGCTILRLAGGLWWIRWLKRHMDGVLIIMQGKGMTWILVLSTLEGNLVEGKMILMEDFFFGNQPKAYNSMDGGN